MDDKKPTATAQPPDDGNATPAAMVRGGIYAVGFMLVLLTPLVFQAAGWRRMPKSEFEAMEHRRIAAFPGLPGKRVRLDEYPKAFEDWYGDHLGLRDDLIRLEAALLFRLNTTIMPDRVTLDGKNGFLFMKRQPLAGGRNLPLLNPKGIANAAKTMTARQA